MQNPAAPNLPHHVAIVMDGNGRWAQKRWLPRVAGHKQGVDALRRIVEASVQRGIRVLTVFAFSSENWSRPVDEVASLMDLLALALSREVPRLSETGVRLHFPGDRSRLSPRLAQGLTSAEEATQGNERLVLNVCFNYGGRWDIAQAAQRLVERGGPITEESLSAVMALSHVPDPDLIIRTGGELRISNFLLWQAAYAELVFSDCLWPEFDAEQLDLALAEYARRERRFGQTSAQRADATALTADAGPRDA
ncbi:MULTISPECIES: polyprenyl diphosphate synthase [Hydrogenophaga]|uniref:Isoprenyl transferase n=1 Tax=Hydrogenophaga intermedia TaxID=65786 RepID=A0A1L1PFC2_HYDIT|nr:MULTISPECIES: polyprenyl diphosphate synthase [Hydrogenophaga]AOS79644.1 di-trans,poly-cis-decaprenylcistransferase [Hydrogenophaga sp. PBC]TMU77189.1 di-trans,poly-cis-decaprenylcistransferase [Hydrogenophaga intermedia]CDN86489.1 Isoprenyl transferase [Hydrogenophaga intermedia]